MKILITDMLHESAEQELAICNKYGIELDTTFCHNEDEIIEVGKLASGLLVSYSKITRRVFESLPNLKVVVKYGIGVDTIDIQAATDHGVIVSNVPDYCLEEVASHALMLILNGLKQTPFFDRSMHQGVWDTQPKSKILYRPSEISLGLVSFGRIARTLASYAKSIFKEVYFYDPYVEEVEIDGCKKVNTLEELFTKSKIISVHTPLHKETKFLIGSDSIKFANGAILVNTSRADVIEPDSVLEGLAHGNLLFFGADTFWPENPDFSSSSTTRFFDRDDVLITPHVAWCSLTAERDVRWKAAENAAKVIVGKLPTSIINKKVLENLKK